MKIVYIREHTDEHGVEYRPGTVREVTPEVASQLIKDGVAQERRERRDPDETKDETDEFDSTDVGDGGEHHIDVPPKKV